MVLVCAQIIRFIRKHFKPVVINKDQKLQKNKVLMTEQIWNLDSEMETKKKKKEAIGNLKLKKIVAGMKFLLDGFNSRFEIAEESLNLKVEQQKLCNPWKKKWPKFQNL